MIMILLMIIIIICCCPVTKSCPALCDSMDCSPQDTLSFTTSWEFAQTHVLWVVMPSNYLILCCPILLLPSIFPSIRVFSSELALCFRWSKYWSFSFSISPSNEYSGFISFRIDWFDLLDVQRVSRVFFSITIWKHQFLGTQPSLWSNCHIHTWLLGKP